MIKRPSEIVENRVRTLKVRQWSSMFGQTKEKEIEKPLEKKENFVRKENSTSGQKLKRKELSERKRKRGKVKFKEDENLYSDIRDFFEKKTVQSERIFKGIEKGQNKFSHQKVGCEANLESDPRIKSQGN